MNNLDDFPRNSFGLVNNIASNITPNTSMIDAIYLSLYASNSNRAVILLRYGATQAGYNSRNDQGGHNGKELVESPQLLHTYIVNGIKANVYRSGYTVMVVISGTLNQDWSSGWHEFGSVPNSMQSTIWFPSGRVLDGQRIDFRVDYGILSCIPRTTISSGTGIYYTFSYICAQ